LLATWWKPCIPTNIGPLSVLHQLSENVTKQLTMSGGGNCCYSHDWLYGLVVSLRQVYRTEPAEYAERVRDKPCPGNSVTIILLVSRTMNSYRRICQIRKS
jgi:hypothetical protein